MSRIGIMLSLSYKNWTVLSSGVFLNYFWAHNKIQYIIVSLSLSLSLSLLSLSLSPLSLSLSLSLSLYIYIYI